MHTALTIAGSDSCGGAGIQADIKTMTANGVYAMSCITALTAQNTKEISGIIETPRDFVAAQMDSIFTDIFPDAVKTGMLPNAFVIEAVADRLSHYSARNVVTDPVMVASSGKPLMEESAITALGEKLLPLVTLVTPNVPEAEILSGLKIRSREDAEEAARTIYGRFGCAALIKGGHLYDPRPIRTGGRKAESPAPAAGENDHSAPGALSSEHADDCLFDGRELTWLPGHRLKNENTHGTGCTLSSAIAANLAKGYDLLPAVRKAKEYLTGVIEAGLNLGQGRGPMNHAFDIKSKFMV